MAGSENICEINALFRELRNQREEYLTIRPAARKGYGSIAHEAKSNGLLIKLINAS